MRPEALEPLGSYGILMNDGHQLLLLLPGCYRGEPAQAELRYNGGEHAILARGEAQQLVCDALNGEVREWIFRNERILVFEEDMKRRYTARVVRSDIDALAGEAVRLHDYCFPHHPYPTADGTFGAGEARCDYCGETVRVWYRGATERGAERTACPRCIFDMAPAWQEDDGLFPGLDEACRRGSGSLFGDTPPYRDQGRPGTLWAFHCGAPAAYLGELAPEDLNGELRAELAETWDHPFNICRQQAPEDALRRFAAGALTAHLFRCTECKKTLCLFYERGGAD